MSALSRATSVPDPIATPTAASTNAGASFTSSPTAATDDIGAQQDDVLSQRLLGLTPSLVDLRQRGGQCGPSV